MGTIIIIIIIIIIITQFIRLVDKNHFSLSN